MTDGATSTEQTHYLNKEEEFRIEVKIGTSVRVTLTDGTAEVFGAELPKGTPVELPGGKHAIFSWHGATIDVSGPTELEYVARDTPPTARASPSSAQPTWANHPWRRS